MSNTTSDLNADLTKVSTDRLLTILKNSQLELAYRFRSAQALSQRITKEPPLRSKLLDTLSNAKIGARSDNVTRQLAARGLYQCRIQATNKILFEGMTASYSEGNLEAAYNTYFHALALRNNQTPYVAKRLCEVFRREDPHQHHLNALAASIGIDDTRLVRSTISFLAKVDDTTLRLTGLETLRIYRPNFDFAASPEFKSLLESCGNVGTIASKAKLLTAARGRFSSSSRAEFQDFLDEDLLREINGGVLIAASDSSHNARMRAMN